MHDLTLESASYNFSYNAYHQVISPALLQSQDELPSNSTNATTDQDEPVRNYFALFLCIIPLLTITGNMLVVAAVFRERALQTVTNYFIVSLAIADFLVALVVMPFAVYVEIVHMRWGWGQIMCNVYIASDVSASTASILNLVAISVDRYIAITHPIQYSRHGKNKQRGYITVGIVWCASLGTAVPILLGINKMKSETTCEFTDPYYILVSSLISFYAPCIIMIILYAIILKRLAERQRRSAKKRRRPTKTGIHINNGAGNQQKPGSRMMGEISGGHAAALLKSAHLVREIGERLELTVEDEFTMDDTYDSLSRSSSTEEKLPTECPRDAPRRQKHTRRITVSHSASFRHQHKHSRGISVSPSGIDRQTEPQANNVACVPLTKESTLKPSLSACPRHSTGSNASNLLSDASILTTGAGQISDSSNQDDVSSRSANCNTAPLSCRSFGDDLELIPFIDSSGPNSRPGSTRVKPAPLENVDQIEEFPKTPSGSVKTRRPLLQSPFQCSFKIRPNGGEIVTEIERKSRTLRESFRDFRRQFMTACWSASRFRLKTLKESGKHVTKREHSRQIRKEQKATQTLAVVLAVFLFCWVPFFTCHLTNAVCIVKENSGCIPFMAFFLTSWLGYMNSFMNPLIYTIFNPEYRKAFRKILLFWRNRRG